MEVDQHQALGGQPQVDRLQVEDTSHQQAGRGHHHHREGDLPGHEHAAPAR